MLCHCRSCSALPHCHCNSPASKEHQRWAQKYLTLPSGEVWKVYYKCSLWVHTEQWGDNKIGNNSLWSGACPSGARNEAWTCVHLEVSHGVKGCTRMNVKDVPIQCCPGHLSHIWVADSENLNEVIAKLFSLCAYVCMKLNTYFYELLLFLTFDIYSLIYISYFKLKLSRYQW